MAESDFQIEAFESHHPLWGSNFANQIKADPIKNGECERPADDDDITKRFFSHTCGIFKTMASTNCFTVLHTFFFEGHCGTGFVPNEIEMRIASSDDEKRLIAKNGGRPYASFKFHGAGKRYGPLRNYHASNIVCVFANRRQEKQYMQQMTSFVLAPKNVIYEDVIYTRRNDLQYYDTDGNLLPALLCLYLFLHDNDKSEFARRNPEVRNMVRKLAK